MLLLKNITITTSKGRVLLNECSFSLNPTDKLAIIGEEGNGKSILCKLIVGEKPLPQDFIVTGSITRTDETVGYLPQALPSEYENVAMSRFLLADDSGIIDYNQLQELIPIFIELGLVLTPDDFERAMNTFSGGERIKIQLAKIMAKKPTSFVLDEPTNDLDIRTLKWFENFLLNSSIPCIFVSHDTALLENVSNRVLHLQQTERKKVPVWALESLNYKDYINKRQADLERQESLSVKQKQSYDKQMDKWRQIYQKVEHRQDTISRQDPHGGQLLKKKMRNLKAVKRRIDSTELLHKPDPEEAISLFFADQQKVSAKRILLEDHCEFLTIGERVLSTELDIRISGNSRIGIFGDNGCGKSTYLKYLKTKAVENGRKIGMMPQKYEELLPNDQSAVDWLINEPSKEYRTKVMNYLGNLKFTEEEMIQPMIACSQGQKAKILLIHLVLGEYEMILLDEPTRNLSPLTLPVIEEMLKNYSGALVCVSHDRRFLVDTCRDIYQMDPEGLDEKSPD